MDNMDHVKLRRPRSITGEFRYSHLKPVSDTNTARGKTISTIESQCELNCDDGSLSMYGLSSGTEKTPFLIIPKIWKVTRNKREKQYFCLEYGTEENRSNIFLTITDKSDADNWEDMLCLITGQTPPIRRRPQTMVTRPKQPGPKRPKENTLSGPMLHGFSSEDKHEDSNEVKEPVEGHIGEVLGYENISPTPENTPSSRHSDHGDDGPDEDDTCKVLEGAFQILLQQQQQQQQQQVLGYENIIPTPESSPSSPHSDYDDDGPDEPCSTIEVPGEASLILLRQHQHQPQFDPEDERPSVIQPLVSNEPTSPEISAPQPLNEEDQPVGEPCSQEEAYCTHMETECSQIKVIVAVDKEEFLRTDKFNDIFVRYQRSIYVKSCPKSLQHQLFIGTRILLVNNEEPSNPASIHRLISEAQNPVNLLVQLFPLGVRVRLRVPSFTDLGIELYGNEITSMRGDGVLSRITGGLRCMGPALSTPDTPHAMYVEQRSITAIGDRHVPFDATTEEVERMLNAAINNGNGLVVLQLHPTEFCHAIAPDALPRRLQKGGVLNPRPNRRPSVVKSLMSNPPLSPT